MPVVFDQVVGTVDAPSAPGEPGGEGGTPPPAAAARQLLAQMLRDHEKRMARVRAD
ncbi:MAG: hypothetical protein WBB01_22725 [Phormidesmis sp.]